MILKRTRRSNHRPLLQTENPADLVTALLAQREPWYRESAHLQLDTGGLNSREIATGILESARYYFSHLTDTPWSPP